MVLDFGLASLSQCSRSGGGGKEARRKGGKEERRSAVRRFLGVGTQVAARVERVEAYYKIESDRHRPDCEAIGSLTFDR